MNQRKLIISLVLVLVAASVVWLLARGNDEESAAATVSETPAISQYDALVVENNQQQLDIPITGRIAPTEKVELLPEASGTLLRGAKPFRVGVSFRRGQTMLKVDSDRIRLDLVAQKSQLLKTLVQVMPDLRLDFPDHFQPWDDYLEAFDLNSTLRPLPPVPTPKFKYFLSARGVYNQYYSIQSMEEQLSQYYITAPFDGTVTAALVSPGAKVGPQTRLGTLSATGAYELETTVGLEELQYIEPGDEVELHSTELSGSWTGTIARIGSTINEASQSVPLFITLGGSNLKGGMFLEGTIETGRVTEEAVMELPQEALIRNDQVYVIEDSVVRTTSVEPVRTYQNQVWVRGLTEGQIVIKEPGSTQLQGTRAIPQLN